MTLDEPHLDPHRSRPRPARRARQRVLRPRRPERAVNAERRDHLAPVGRVAATRGRHGVRAGGPGAAGVTAPLASTSRSTAAPTTRRWQLIRASGTGDGAAGLAHRRFRPRRSPYVGDRVPWPTRYYAWATQVDDVGLRADAAGCGAVGGDGARAHVVGQRRDRRRAPRRRAAFGDRPRLAARRRPPARARSSTTSTGSAWPTRSWLSCSRRTMGSRGRTRHAAAGGTRRCARPGVPYRRRGTRFRVPRRGGWDGERRFAGKGEPMGVSGDSCGTAAPGDDVPLGWVSSVERRPYPVLLRPVRAREPARDRGAPRRRRGGDRAEAVRVRRRRSRAASAPARRGTAPRRRAGTARRCRRARPGGSAGTPAAG